MGVVWCVRNTMSTYANLLCRMAVHSSEFRSQTRSDLELTIKLLATWSISGKYMPRSQTLRWEKIYFHALDFSGGAQNLGCLATGQARARKKIWKNIFSPSRKSNLDLKIQIFSSKFSKIRNFENWKIEIFKIFENSKKLGFSKILMKKKIFQNCQKYFFRKSVFSKSIFSKMRKYFFIIQKNKKSVFDEKPKSARILSNSFGARR